MKINEKYGKLASDLNIKKVSEALLKNGMTAIVVNNSKAAKEKVLEIIPRGAEVMNMTSTTLESTGILDALRNSDKIDFLRKRLETMDNKTQKLEKRRLGAAPEWAVGSIHALTKDGQIMVASQSGSQLPAYAYGALHVIWVVGTQKIVKDLDDGMRRIFEYALPLENERALKAYGTGSNVNKVLIINKEIIPGRITVILVREKLGF